MIKTYKTSSSIRLRARFHNYSNEVIEPNVVKVKFYDYKYELLQEHSLSNANLMPDGSYYYDLVLPDEEGTYVYEWYSENDGVPAVEREKINVSFLGYW